jgi:hypothetical protein
MITDDLEKMLDYIEQLRDNVNEEAGQLIIGTASCELKDNIQFALILDKIHDVAEEISKVWGRTSEGLCARINKMIEQSGFENLDIKFRGSVQRVTPDLKFAITCPSEKQPQMIDWMKKDSHGKELIKETVHPKTLQSFMEKKVEAGEDIKQLPFLNVHIMQSIKIRKLPK